MWNQCTLPVKDGGLGIRSAQDLSLPAFLSSYTASIQIAHSMLPYGLRDVHSSYFDIGCNQWMNNLGITEIREYSNFQSEWDKPICKLKIKSLIDNAQSDTEKGRLRSISSEGASAWLNALPLPSLGLKLSDTELPILCSLRLGATMCHPYLCICGKMVESDGRHGLNCDQQIGRFPIHTEANVLIKRALSQIDCPSILEPKNLLDS